MVKVLSKVLINSADVVGLFFLLLWQRCCIWPWIQGGCFGNLKFIVFHFLSRGFQSIVGVVLFLVEATLKSFQRTAVLFLTNYLIKFYN